MHLRLNSHRPGLLKLLQFVLVSLVIAGPARALDPEKSIAQYGHSAWTLQDGSIPGAPIAMVQTADGYLWLGTRAGVVRFDGVRFVPLTPPGAEQLVSPRVLSLGTSHDGSLWIGLRGDLERWYAGHLTHYPDAPGSINSINEDEAGKVWFTRISSDSDGALCEVVGERSVCHGSADGVPLKDLQQVISGPHDSLWAISQTTLMRRQSNATHTWLPPGVSGSDEGRAALDVLQSVLPTADGAVWVGAAQPSRGLGLLRLMKDEMQPFVVPHLDGRRLAVSRLLLDRQKWLWIGTQEDGVYRLSGDQGVPEPSMVSPDAWEHAQWGMDRPGDKEIQFALHANYGSNVERYDEWHTYFREWQPPALIVWGKGDFVFLSAGAEAYRKDLKHLEIHMLDAGHFALETHATEIAGYIRKFMATHR